MFDVWKSVLAEVEQTIPREQFSTWFTGTELMGADRGVVTVGVPNVFKIKQLQVKYTEVLRRALEHNQVPVTEIKYVVQSGVKPRVRSREITEVARPVMSVGQAAATARTRRRESATGLNDRYTLDNFVIGSNNDLAVSVARNIIESPGVKYNPFFLYGGSGLGKTHLVQAIGNALLQRNPGMKILYTPISSFYADFIKHIQNRKGDDFRQKFRKLDVLIVDDFQMIMNKDASQVEFFDIFNDLYQLNKQIIVTSDRLPSQIKSVDERLASRLTWAGAFDLQLPQFEDKCAILRAKAEFRGAQIEDEAIEYLAENVKTNIRDLEGEFEKLLAIADLRNMTPLAIINEGYMNTGQTAGARTVSPRQVVEKVAKYYGLTSKELMSRSRVANIKNARQVAMYVLSKDLALSTTKITGEVGVSDHSTVMHGIRKIEKDLKLNFALRDQIAAIREQLYG